MGVFLITAPSGAGKTTIAQHMQRMGIWGECISHTTRPMRAGEREGVTYYFINKVSFADLYSKGFFAEKVEYDGNLYGVSNDEIQRVMKKYKHVFIIVEFDGYQQIKDLYPDAVGIFIHMSKEDCVANMLMRGDTLEKALKRADKYEEEMANRSEFDYVVKNVRGKFSETVRVVQSIVLQNQ